LFGFIDIVVLDPIDCYDIIGVQATTDAGGHVAARVAKIMDEPRARAWLDCGGRIWVCGWAKKGPRGEEKKWTVRVIEVEKSNGQTTNGMKVTDITQTLTE
jgi:hypothetical protein